MSLNLILNAINASKEDGKIKISLGNIGNHYCELKVADEGIGMKADELEHAFEPFYTTRAEGTGLGLAIVKSIVDSHRGRVSLTSEAGRGTLAKVNIPLLSKGDDI
ncbi:MAG: sensor histidine kinase [Acidobacteria bacterium]|nr:sensor histidine kinase [Acidobacteriota bacterium]